MDMEKAHDDMCRVIGEAVVQVIGQAVPVIKDAIAEMVAILSVDETDLAVDFALDLLRSKAQNPYI